MRLVHSFTGMLGVRTGDVRSSFIIPTLLKKDSGDLWDSGKTASDASTQVADAGKPRDKVRGVERLRAEGGSVALAVESGEYHFKAR